MLELLGPKTEADKATAGGKNKVGNGISTALYTVPTNRDYDNCCHVNHVIGFSGGQEEGEGRNQC